MSCKPIRPDYNHANYDETKVAPFKLEDPLTFQDGTKVKTKKDWERRRREILDIFAKEMYGQEPPKPKALVTERWEQNTEVLGGFAVREQYKMYFDKDKHSYCVNWLLYRPSHAKGPVPVVIFLNYKGNFELMPDVEIPAMTAWSRNNDFSVNHKVLPSVRGRHFVDPNCATTFPIGNIIARGYAVLTACYCEISPDPDYTEPNPAFTQENFAYTRLFELWGKRDESRDDNITSLGAWAWALSRGLDLAERIPELDAKRCVVTGSSRLGKAAFIAAARDERFAVCVPNQCGGGGICLAKRDYGECIGTEVRMFKHWYCKAYNKYAINPPKLLHFDQHLLLAAIAPRAVLVEGFGSPWFDTKGEYLAVQAASPVWKFLGLQGMPDKDFPDYYDTSCIGKYVGYVRRTEAHGIADIDWLWMLNFADNALKNK